MRIVLSVIARSQLAKVDQSALVDRQVSHSHAVLFQALRAVDDRLVLGNACNDVVTLLAIHLGDTL